MRYISLISMIFTTTAFTACGGANPAPVPGAPIAWESDIDLLVKEFPERDKGLTPDTRAEFLKRMEALRRDFPTMDEQHITVAILQAVAVAHNAHTLARPRPGHPLFTRVPVAVHAFSDGLFIVKTRPELSGLLGAKLVSVSGKDTETVMEQVATTFYGNASWRRYIGATLITMPGLLYGLDVTTDPKGFEIEVEKGDGTRIKQRLDAEAPVAPARSEAWWNLAPTRTREDMNWKFAFDTEATPLPLYLKDPNRPLWVEYLDAHKILYVQYNSSSEEDGSSVKEQSATLLGALDKHEIQKVIVDLRFNTGGNLMLMRGVFERMLRKDVFKQPDSLFVITGTSTFSAGLFCAANLKQEGKAIVVGELAGDDLDFWAEGGKGIELPNSRMWVHPQSGFHSYSTVARPDLEDYLYLDLGIDTLEPDMPAGMTFEEYASGQDPAVERILAL